MAIILLEDFDDTASGTGVTGRKPWWSGSIFTHTTGRHGTGLLTGDNANRESVLSFGGTYKTLIMGFACRILDHGSANPYRIMVFNGGGGLVELRVQHDGAIRFTGVWGQGATSAVGVLPLNEWRYVEVKFVVDDTNGSYEVRVNQNTELSDSGIDTYSSGAVGTSSVNLKGTFGGADVDDIRWDDIYVLDDTGGVNDDFLGDVTVYTLRPDGDGNTSGLTNSGGDSINNWSYVDDGATPSSADYVGSKIEGDLDTYTMTGLSSTAFEVHAMQTTIWCEKDSVGLKYMRPIVRTGSTGGAQSDNVGDTIVLTEVYEYYMEPWDVNPDTGVGWTEGEINAIEIGQEVRDST